MNRLLIGLCLASGTFGFAMACKPVEQAQFDESAVTRTIKPDGTEVITPKYVEATAEQLNESFPAPSGPAYTAAHDKTSTGKLIREIAEMDRTTCAGEDIDAATCSARIANRQLELEERCEGGHDAIACEALEPNG